MAVDAGGQVPFAELRNWEGGTMSDVLNFIERKSRIRLQNAKQAGGTITGEVPPNKTRDLEKWSSVQFAGRKLNIKIVYKSAEQSAESSALYTLLSQVLQSRYNPAARLLDLSRITSDPVLMQQGLLADAEKTVKVFKALLRVAGDNLKDVDSVSLEGNFLTDVDLVENVATAFPKLLNLSLANNQISGVAQFVRLRNKFPLLRELLLAGNPLQQNPAYQSQAGELVAMFPRLVILDGITVRNEADLPKNALPAPIKPTFFEDEGVASMTPMFLANFFSLWDNDRAALLALYDQASFFSLALDTASPHSPTSKQAPASYIQMSRNLVRNHSQQSRHHRVYFGPSQVATAFTKVPGSRHDLNNASAFAIESWKVSDVRSPGDTAIMMVVHGEFEETTNTKITTNTNAKVMRSFDRSLVVLPGPNMSYVIASDLLSIRMHSKLPVSAAGGAPAAGPVPAPATPANGPSPAISAAGTPAPGAPAPGVPTQGMPAPNPGAPAPTMGTPAPVPNAIPPDALLQEFVRQTGLTAEYADMCLKQANYDPNVAMQLFQQSRAQLPPNAFIQ